MASSTSKINIFITGSTGYIGGSVLAKLLQHDNFAQFHITALLRTPEKAHILREHNIEPLIGSNEDLEKLEAAAANSDVVLSLADADNLPAIQAILRGSKTRFLNTRKKPIVIHTSGTGVIAEAPGGSYAEVTVYNDADTSQMASLDIGRIHRNVDIELINADKEDFANTYIILPSAIYGLATHKFTHVKFSNRHSMLIPVYIRAALHRGQAGYVGEGKNTWPYVHIDDVRDLHIQILQLALADKIGHGTNGYYFAENGEASFGDISKAIAQNLWELGKISTPNAAPFTEVELTQYFGHVGPFFGTNCRATADHSRAIGWRPKYTVQDVYTSIKPEIEVILQSPPRDLPYF